MHSVSVEAWVEYMGDRATPEDAKRLTDPKTGKIMNPNDSADIESRPDHEEFKGAEVVEMGAIERRGTFSEPMRMSAIRAKGITSKPVKCRSIWEIKEKPSPDGKGTVLDKFKMRYVLCGHPGNMTRNRDYWETFTAAPNAATGRILCWLVAQGFHRDCVDAMTAYLFGRLKEEELVVVQLDKGHRTYDPETGEELFRICLGSLYGHPSAGVRWAERRNEHLMKTFNNAEWTVTKCVYDGGLFCFRRTWPLGTAPPGYPVGENTGGKTKSSSNSNSELGLGAMSSAIPDREGSNLRVGKQAGRGAQLSSGFGKSGRGRKSKTATNAYVAKVGKYDLADDPSINGGNCEISKWLRGGLDEKGRIVTLSFSSIYTDDFDIVAENKGDADIVKAALKKEFGIKQCNPVHMLGLERIICDGGNAVEVRMPAYIAGVYLQFKDVVGTRIPKTPMVPNDFLTRADCGPDDTSAKFPRFGVIVGCLLWIARMAKPEISLTVGMLCKMMGTPTEAAWKAALYCLAYCYGTKDKGVKFKRVDGQPEITAWYDASNKGDEASKGRAMAGYCVMISGSPIEWRSRLNAHPGQSAQHNEYQALAATCKAGVWVRHMLVEMGFGSWAVATALPVIGDNAAAIALCKKDILTLGNRFYTKDLHYSKDQYDRGIICPRKIPTDDNISDGFTKSLPACKHELFTPQLCGYEDIPATPPAERG
jgi:hypothetical protein